jgi:putative inorganic carbon (hco3(-)) transporter
MRKIKKTNSQKSIISTIAHPHFLILMAYGLITILTPNLGAYDSNGPKFLSLAILNSIVFGYWFLQNEHICTPNYFKRFFFSKIGIIFTTIILISGLSIIKSINTSESILHLSKLFTVYLATFIVANIFLDKKILLLPFITAIIGLILFDTFYVYHDIYNYIQGNISNLTEIKAGYSNKNILAAAIFIKLPFALYLFTFKKRWLSTIGILTILMASIAILFLNTRSFYLGLIVLSLLYSLYLITLFTQRKEKTFFKKTVIYLGVIILSFIIYLGVENTFFPKESSGYDTNLEVRLTSVADEDSDGGRLQMWRFTTEIIQDNLLLGIGAGNWKIAILEKENQIKSDFKLFLHNHNDFLQIPAEIGLFGGILFIFLFFLAIFYFLKSIYRKDFENASFLFLPAFGLLCYSFDAFFNFPHDRPEIQSIFALYLGLGIAYSYKISQIKESFRSTTLKSKIVIPSMLTLLSITSIVILYFNFSSLKTQNLIVAAKKGSYEITSHKLIQDLPIIPNIAVVGDPINGLIASQLNKEKKYNEALEYLNKNNPSPFDSRIEFYKSFSFFKLNELDSATYYIKKARQLKPLYYLYTQHYANILESQGNIHEAIEILDSYLNKNPRVKDTWLYKAALTSKLSEPLRASQIIDSSFHYFPNDSNLSKVKEIYLREYYMPTYNDAINYYNNEDYLKAINLFEDSKEGYDKLGGHKKFPNFLNSWARSYLNVNNITAAKRIFKQVIIEDPKNYYALHNLGFIAFNYEKKYYEAINYFNQCIASENSDLFSTYRNLGTLYLLTNQSEKAIKSYEESLEYGSTDAIYRNLYLLYKEKGNVDKMKEYQNKLKRKL